jgi:hypothetical protein
MLKFREKHTNIDEAYNYFKMIIKSTEWNVKNKFNKIYLLFFSNLRLLYHLIYICNLFI